MILLAGGPLALGQSSIGALHAAKGLEDPPDFSVVPESQWQAIERSVDRGIDHMLSQQYRDGSFGIGELEKPAVTSLVCMAMISRGHLPDVSANATAESKAIIRSIDYVLSCQRVDGLLGYSAKTTSSHNYTAFNFSKFMNYNHAICGLFLTEVYGMTGPVRAGKIEASVDRALAFVRREQQRHIAPEVEARDRGGWRYIGDPDIDNFYSDLSVTSWVVMFLRSAENAGFDVPIEWAKQALAYVLRCYDKPTGTFGYAPGHPHMATRGLLGAGTVCLFLTGHKDRVMEQKTAQLIKDQPFSRYNYQSHKREHYHYSAYYISQAAMQIGGQTWEQFYPEFANTLIEHQHRDGSWEPESKRPDLGNVYPTALSVLALTPPYQLLPIYQR
ncbi:putative secreted protein [Rhodopirellula sp. SWK7]|nr:putative secreted protein [Rhodopirellula sp. SWK7]